MAGIPRLQRYQVLGRLATGGMAEVWLGRAIGFGGFEKLVVLKTILKNLTDNTQFVQMFINEARVAAMLNHPNCVQIFELGKEDDALYIAMEYIEGFSLSRVLKRSVTKGLKMPMEVLARVCADALSGLDHAHRLCDRDGQPVGLIHRDVSPDNLLLSFAGQTKVVDFGIAKARLSASQATRAGTVKGKFGYIAPEYLRGQPIDARADLFALGVVMYRAMTGARPWVGPSEAAVTLAVLREEAKWPTDVDPSLPQAISAVVMMALEKDPSARFETAKAMRRAIEAAVRPTDSEGVAAYLEQLWPRGDPERSALDLLAAGRAEERSDPLLQSVVSSGFELPEGALSSALRAEAERAIGPLNPTVVVSKPPAIPEREQPAAARPRRPSMKWVALSVSLIAGAGVAWAVKRPAPVAPASVAPPAAAPVTGSVTVDVGVAVTVLAGDHELGSSPGRFELPPGLARLTLRGPGIDQAFDVEVKAGQTVALSELRKGTLSVRVEPWAYVKIDGKPAGQTPVRRELFEGPHVVELSNTELNATRRVDVHIKRGETRSLALSLE